MAASSGVLSWTRDSFWQQPANHYHGNQMPCSSQAAATTHSAAAVRHDVAEESSSSGNSEGGDYSLRAHELIASPTSLYEVLETLGEATMSLGAT